VLRDGCIPRATSTIRVAAIIAATQDPNEVQRILEEEIEEICQQIADAERPRGL